MIEINPSEWGSSWGIVLTYSTPGDRERLFDELDSEMAHFRRHTAPDNIQNLELPRGVVNCIDLSGHPALLSGETATGQELMGWVKSRQVILLCKDWEWELLQEENGRWTKHLDRVESVSSIPETLADAVTTLLQDRQISRLSQRVVVHEYLQHRSSFGRFLEAIDTDRTALRDLIEEKNLWSLDETERELLLLSNDELYRYLCAHALDSRPGTDFNRQTFRERFGEIPFRVGFESDTAVFQDLVDQLEDRQCTDLTDFTGIETLATLLMLDGPEEPLRDDLYTFCEQEPGRLYVAAQDTGRHEEIIDRGSFIAEFIEDEDSQSAYNTLLAIVSLIQLEGAKDSPLALLNRYHGTGIRPQYKAWVSRMLVHMLRRDGFAADANHRRIVEFLREPGPKVVLLLDGLPLTNDTSIDYLQRKQRDERWEVGYGVAPVPSITEQFRSSLNDVYDFEQLGGFVQDSGVDLAQIELDAFLGDREDELIGLLNNDESVIIYDSAIDRSGRFPTDVNMKIQSYWTQKIDDFVVKFGSYADILIVADHGLVKTHVDKAIPTPSQADKRGLGHCRVCFTDDELSEDERMRQGLNISQESVNLPETAERCTMLNPNVPNAKFGTQQDDLWTHGGISIEESLVPFVVRRRSP